MNIILNPQGKYIENLWERIYEAYGDTWTRKKVDGNLTLKFLTELNKVGLFYWVSGCIDKQSRNI